MFCPRCRRENPENNKFCNGCGSTFNVVSIPPQAFIPPPPAPPKQQINKPEIFHNTEIQVIEPEQNIPKVEFEKDLADKEPVKNDLPITFENEDSESVLQNEDLSKVFEDAENILEEILTETKNEGSTEAKFTDPDSKLETASNLKIETETNNDFAVDSALDNYFTDIETKSGAPAYKSNGLSKNAMLVGVVGIIGLIIFGGIVGLWLFKKDNEIAKSEPVNSNLTIEQPKTDVPPPGMAFIPGGEYMMGSDSGDEYSRPAHKVSVEPFFIDITETTNEEYKKFIDATNYKLPPDWKNKSFPEGKARFPVVGVDWDDAQAFAKWAGKRLPTEEEWEFAARGTDGRKYPWGNEWRKELTNAENQNSGMTEVGKAQGISQYGLYDTSGNAWEWTASDAKAYTNGSEFDENLISPKIIRSGYWGSSKEVASTIGRRAYGARGEKGGYGNTGFRCVKDISPK